MYMYAHKHAMDVQACANRIDRRMHGWTDACMQGRLDGMEERKDGRMDGRIDIDGQAGRQAASQPARQAQPGSHADRQRDGYIDRLICR